MSTPVTKSMSSSLDANLSRGVREALLRRFEAQRSSKAIVGVFLVSIAQRSDDVTCAYLLEKIGLPVYWHCLAH